MTKKELNRDIKRLANNYQNMGEEDLRKEFKRLYYWDPAMDLMNVYSVRMMLRLNLKYRFISLHYYGTAIDLPNEK